MKYMVTYQEPRCDLNLGDEDCKKIEVGLAVEVNLRGEPRKGTVSFVDHASGEVTVKLDEEPLVNPNWWADTLDGLIAGKPDSVNDIKSFQNWIVSATNHTKKEVDTFVSMAQGQNIFEG